MTTLEQMILDLCPDGVKYMTINECIEKVANIRWENHLNETYRYIDLTSVDRNNHTICDTQEINSENAPSRAQQIVHENDILLGATRPLLKRYCVIPKEYDGQICSTGFCVLRAKEEVVTYRFLYHIISSTDFFTYVEQHQKGASYPAISDADTKLYTFPVPPLALQCEIVRILDKFAELTAELTEKLTAELTARKEQFNYYRDEILNNERWSKCRIIDMLSQSITDGPHTTPKFFSSGIPFISVESIWNGKIHFEKMRGYIDEAFYNECCKKYKPQLHDIFMVKSGSTTGKVAYVDTEIKFNIWSPLAAMRVNKNNSPRFLYHLLQTEYIQRQVRAQASHGSQPNLSMRTLENFEAFVPPLHEQNRIASILDRFDALCNDITQGLPAEIEARQKQYEYYRDKLLAFKEKSIESELKS